MSEGHLFGSEDKDSYLTSRLCEELLGKWERRPAIALFSWKLIRPKLVTEPSVNTKQLCDVSTSEPSGSVCESQNTPICSCCQ